MDGDVCVLPEIVDVCQAPRRPRPHRRGALDVPVRPERARRGRALRPRRRGRLPPRHLLQEPRGPGRFRLRRRRTSSTTSTRFARSRFFSCNLAPMVAAGLAGGGQDRGERAQLRARLWSNVAFLRRRFAEEGDRHRQVHVAGHAGHGQQRRQGLRGRGEDPGPRPVPAARSRIPPSPSTSRGCGCRSPPPHSEESWRRRCRSSPACSGKRACAGA